jgi:enoyl-CoA hydratase/carnithine racemase
MRATSDRRVPGRAPAVREARARSATGAGRPALRRYGVPEGWGLPVLGMALARDRIAPTDLGPSTLRAQIYGPEQAARVGFLDEVVAAADVIARAREEAARLGAFSRAAYHGTKRRLRSKTIEHILSTLEEDLQTIGRAEP